MCIVSKIVKYVVKYSIVYLLILNILNRLVATTLSIKNIEDNYIQFWLADTLTIVVKNIHCTQMNTLQGIIVVHWIIHYMYLVIGKK